MATPIGVVAHIAHSGNCFEAVGGNKVKEFFPHWGQIDEVFALSCVLLCDLELHSLRRFVHVIEDWSVGFSWLEVERSVLTLQNYIAAE